MTRETNARSAPDPKYTEMQTTEYTEHTENLRVERVSNHTQKMNCTNIITDSFFRVFSVFRGLPCSLLG